MWPSLGLLVLVSCNERGRSYCTESPYTGFGGYLEYVSIARSNIMVHYLQCISSASPIHDSKGVGSHARLCKQAI